MSYYLPETAIVPFTTIRRERVLHMPGEVLVSLGQQVAPDDLVARAMPASVALPHSSAPPQVKAQLWGEVVSILPRYGAVVETTGALLRGKWGMGHTYHGTIKIAVRRPDRHLAPADIDERHRGMVVIGGSSVGEATLCRAAELGVAGIVVGGIEAAVMPRMKHCHVAVIITEGFGDLPMAKPIFELLCACDGCRATLVPTTKLSWQRTKPEIIIVRDKVDDAERNPIFKGQEARAGRRVRVTRSPYYAQLGVIKSLTASTRKLVSGLEKEVAELELDNGKIVTVPLSNLELLELSSEQTARFP